MRLWAYIFGAVVLIVAGIFLWHRYGPEDALVAPPAAGTVPVVVAPHITHGNASLPAPDEHTTGVLHVIIPPDTVPTGKPRDIVIYLNDDPGKPPMLRTDFPVQSTFTPVVDPWLKLETRLSVGASYSDDVSPWGGIALVQLWRNVDVGAGIDDDGIGIFASYRIWREFSVGAMWYALPVFDSDARAAITISYEF